MSLLSSRVAVGINMCTSSYSQFFFFASFFFLLHVKIKASNITTKKNVDRFFHFLVFTQKKYAFRSFSCHISDQNFCRKIHDRTTAITGQTEFELLYSQGTDAQPATAFLSSVRCLIKVFFHNKSHISSCDSDDSHMTLMTQM